MVIKLDMLLVTDKPDLYTGNSFTGETVYHNSDVIVIAMASPSTSLTIVYSTVYSGADQRMHQCSTSLAFVSGRSAVAGQIPAQRTSNEGNVPIWWRHNVHIKSDPDDSWQPMRLAHLCWHLYLWWRRDMEILSEVLDLCEGIPSVIGWFLSRRVIVPIVDSQQKLLDDSCNITLNIILPYLPHISYGRIWHALCWCFFALVSKLDYYGETRVDL